LIFIEVSLSVRCVRGFGILHNAQMGGSTMERFNVRPVVQIREFPHPKDTKTQEDRGVAENAVDFQCVSSSSRIREMRERRGLPLRFFPTAVITGGSSGISVFHHLLHRRNVDSRVQHLGGKVRRLFLNHQDGPTDCGVPHFPQDVPGRAP
jgi:hypothetical protein